ncbi:b-box type zinc finger protein ncl-1 [Apostichopus japonicus]|uniref:B-box type zinc finger protein ncl-1 n=1 Tax=Stichopus japonicus TaxID=307972 RepID=A0A2G8KT11_STIJA|nr:b-box type zinc finger protein ncl-1 [Apostichopus japonicus]
MWYAPNKEDEASVERCLDHEDQTMKYFCLSCLSKICPDCLYSAHNPKTNCEVIKISEISDQVSKHQQNLIQEIEAAETSSLSAKNFWKEKKNSLRKTRQDARAKIHEDFLILLEKAEKLKRDLTQEVDRKEVSDQKQLLEDIHEIQILDKELERLAKLKKNKTEKSSHDSKN